MKAQRIEFLGMPGSGKTTLAKLAAKQLVKSEHKVVLLPEAISLLTHRDFHDRKVSIVLAAAPPHIRRRIAEWLFVHSNDRFTSLRDFAANNPNLFRVVFASLDRRVEYELRPDLVVGWFLELSARFQAATSSLQAEATLLLDEGFANRAITLFGHRFADADRGDLAAYLQAIPRPDLVIYLEVAESEARQRLERVGRVGSVRTHEQDVSTQIQFLADASACAKVSAQVLASLGVPVHSVTTKGGIDHVAELVGDLIRHAIENRGHQAE